MLKYMFTVDFESDTRLGQYDITALADDLKEAVERAFIVIETSNIKVTWRDHR